MTAKMKKKKQKTTTVLEIAVASAVTSFWTSIRAEHQNSVQSSAAVDTHWILCCFSHHLLAKTAGKQIWTPYISSGISRRCPPGVRNKPVKVSRRGGNRDPSIYLSICLSRFLSVCLFTEGNWQPCVLQAPAGELVGGLNSNSKRIKYT